MITQAEELHYRRQIKLPEIGDTGQAKLNNARVLYVGAGGLGSSALLYLAAAGVGTLGIIDDDFVEAHNLHRQVLYSYADIGCNKAITAKKKLQALNPFIQVNAHHIRLSQQNAEQLIAQYDIIANGSDNFFTHYLVNDVCTDQNKSHVYASISQFSGQCSIFSTKNGPCLRCLFEYSQSETIPNCAEAGVLGVLPGIIGSIQAAEIIKLILEIGKPLVNRWLFLDALKMEIREFQINKNPYCLSCHRDPPDLLAEQELKNDAMTVDSVNAISVSELQNLLHRQDNMILLDVRDEYEYQICHLGGKLIPLTALTSRLSELDKLQHVIIYCKHGTRSKSAAAILAVHGFKRISYLKGGIIEWIEKVNPTMTRY
jgi:adenylyltransferase/sulfurtransferase